MMCVKCGNQSEIMMRWHEAAAHPWSKNCGWSRLQERKEHLHYTCGRCGYEWTGPTREQAAKGQRGGD